MLDIMEDLKENIQKKNMKKLVLFTSLGMFCYCLNNGMEELSDNNNNINKIGNVDTHEQVQQQPQPKEDDQSKVVIAKGEEDRLTENNKKINKKTLKKENLTVEEASCPCCCCCEKQKPAPKKEEVLVYEEEKREDNNEEKDKVKSDTNENGNIIEGSFSQEIDEEETEGKDNNEQNDEQADILINLGQLDSGGGEE